ncbi:MAG TPA: T9SS type A sorting domain-containing protein [Ignavibacteria bacterium]|nr:T9SS type A sorting domain-containing protein [Ignavibacteria bacterium]
MKKLLLFCSVLFIGASLSAQTTATNFTCNDCASTSHTLFTELDAGKVIVLVWVMPCATCIGPSQSAYAAAQSFSSSHPGRVLFYLADDVGTTACSTLNSWATTNSMPNSTKFSNPAIKMTDYGTAGMPKVVILGGTNHTVFYNANNTFSSSAMSTAITNALNAGTGITEPANIFSINLFPNPANVSTSISYSLESSSDVTIEIFNLVGEKTKSVFSGNQNAGEHAIDVDCTKLSNGIYFVKLSAGKIEKTIMFSVAH